MPSFFIALPNPLNDRPPRVCEARRRFSPIAARATKPGSEMTNASAPAREPL
jgi:hypothetical protein